MCPLFVCSRLCTVNRAVCCRNTILRGCNLILRSVTRQGHDKRTAVVGAVACAVQLDDLAAHLCGDGFLAAVFQCARVRRIDRTEAPGIDRRGGCHALCQRTGVIHRNADADNAHTLTRNLLCCLDRRYRTAHLAHRRSDGYRGRLSGANAAGIFGAERQRQLHLAVIYHVADDLTLAYLLTDTEGHILVVRILGRNQFAGKRRRDVQTAQFSLRRAQVGLCLGDLQLRVRDTAFRLGQFLLCIRKLLAGFGRVDHQQRIAGVYLVALGDQHLCYLALNLPAKFLAFFCSSNAASLYVGLQIAAADHSRGLRHVLRTRIAGFHHSPDAAAKQQRNCRRRNADARTLAQSALFAIHFVCVFVALRRRLGCRLCRDFILYRRHCLRLL